MTGETHDLYWRSADGLRLHARDHPAGGGGEDGARLPVLCLHGLTRNARDFDELAPRLAAAGRRVLAADMRGRGLSDRDPRARYALPVYADDVACLLDAAGLARAVVVGTSMGGLIAAELALRHPGRIAGAVVNDVGPELDPAGLARIAGYAGRPSAAADWAAAADDARRLNAHALPHYGPADWDRMARRLFRWSGGRPVLDYDPAIARPAPDLPPAHEPWAAWAALAAAGPVLLLRAARSDILAPGTARRMAAAGDVLLVEVPGVGHAPMLDEPAAARAIDRFLRRLP